MSQQIEIHLPYFKRGDDLNLFLKDNPGSPSKAFLDHAQMLTETASFLTKASEIIGRYNKDEISIQADCHFIWIDGPDEMCKELLATVYCCPASDYCDADEEEEGLEEDENPGEA